MVYTFCLNANIYPKADKIFLVSGAPGNTAQGCPFNVAKQQSVTEPGLSKLLDSQHLVNMP